MSQFERSRNAKSRNREYGRGRRVRLSFEQLEPRCLLSVNVTTWHNDLTRQGLNTNETILTPANVNSATFGKLFSYTVTGQVYAEPLYVSNLNMGALGTHNVVFVATEDNDVYAFDAVNNGAGGGLLWHVGPSTLGTAATTPNTYFGNRYNGGQYLDITPQVGITSTPVIDLATNTMYLDAFTNDAVGQYSHHIWALDITTGAQKMAPVLVAASVQGNNPGDSVGGTITFVAKQQIQRAALTLLNGVLYVAYAGYADTDPYHGWILGYNASNLSLTKVFNDTAQLATPEDAAPHQGEGGIWMTGAGLASDGTHLFVITGNGDFDATAKDWGDTILKLTPDNSTQPTNKNGYGLSVTDPSHDFFTPWNEQTLSDNDTDLGSGGAMLLPDQPGLHPHELVGAGKGGIVYLLDQNSFGGHGASSDNVIGTASMAHATSSAAYFNNYVYYHAFGDVLKAFKLSNGGITPAPVASGGSNYAFPGATPAVSSYGNSANGIIWETQYSTSNAVLRAYNTVPSGSTLTTIYSSGSALGAGVKFTVPTVADGRVYVGLSGALAVFGLTSNPNTAPSAPTNLTATVSPANGVQVQLSWTDNANNENAFKIERSDSGGPFVQIDTASVNAISYTDTGVIAGTTYTYRVRATNPIGDSNNTDPASATPVLTVPVALYHFDDGADTFAADTVGINTGVLVGATKPEWVAGRVGSNALNFSGTGAYNQTNQSAVQLSSNLVPTLGTTSTFAAWIKTTQTGSNNHVQAPAITGVDQAGTSSDIDWGTLNASGQIGIYVGDTGGAYSTVPINDGQWHHVAMTRDATTGSVQLYLDGVLNNSGTFDTGTKAAQFYLIGALTDRNSSGYVTGANSFNGQLDEVRTYNRVLTASEIAQLGQPPSSPSGLSVDTIRDTGAMLRLSWTNTSDVAENVQVERKAGDDGTFEQIATLDGAENTYIDTNLEPGTEYFYRVQASDAGGTSDYSNEAGAVPPHTQILGRFIFYNGSTWINEKATSSYIDALAIATDKQPLLPGQTATFQNYTSYSKGINGIMIDVTNFDGSITPDDFTVMVGNSPDINTWQPGPEPAYVVEYPGSGVGGSIRLELIWDINAIQNEWAQVTLKANDNTRLAADDVFYFGNVVGETGNSTTDAIVDQADVLAVHNNYTTTASITNPYDFNRDKVVDATDEMIAQSNTGASPLLLITVPGDNFAPHVVIGDNSATAGQPDSSALASPLGDMTEAVANSPSLVLPPPLSHPMANDDRPKPIDVAWNAYSTFSSHALADSLLNWTTASRDTPTANSERSTADHVTTDHTSPHESRELAVDDLLAGDFAQFFSDDRSLAKLRLPRLG